MSGGRLASPAAVAKWRAAHGNMAVEVIARILCALGGVVFCSRLWGVYSSNPSWYVILLGLTEGLAFVFLVTARFATAADRSLPIVIVTAASVFQLTSLQVMERPAVAPAVICYALLGCGLVLQVIAKVALGRSFGILPVNRGIVTRGPYRLLRHPIYCGYIISDIGLLLASFSLHNLAVYAFYNYLQVIRILWEERLLLQDAAYRSYAARVRWRVLPYVF